MMLLSKTPAVAAAQCRRVVQAAPAMLQNSRRALKVAAFKEEQPADVPPAKTNGAQDKAVTRTGPQQGGALQAHRRDVHPLRRMNDMVREMDSLMNSFFGPSFSASSMFPRSAFDLLESPSALLPAMPELQPMRSLSLHVDQDDKAYYVQAEVPGFSKDEVKIHLNPDNTLSISAETKAEEDNKDKEGKVTRFSRRQSSFYRSVLLPDNVDPDAIAATTQNGLLTVTIPKKEIPEVKPKQIPVH